MKVADFYQLGMLPLQDHRELLPEFRASIQCGRIESRDAFGKYTVEGHQESESPTQTLGDLLGGFFVPQESPSTRQQGAWFFAGPCVTTRGSVRSGDSSQSTENQTRTRGDGDDQQRTVTVRPVGDLDWSVDDRFLEFEVQLHPDTPNLASGSPLVVLQTTKEDEQQLLGFPTGSNVLIAANEAGNPNLSSIVYDLTADDKIDKDRSAFLHTFWRVAKLGGGCRLGSNDALVWQLGTSNLDHLDGRGLVIDTAGVPVAASPEAPEPGSVEAQDGKAGASQVGAVTTQAEFLKALFDRLSRARGGGGTQVGAVTIGGKVPLKTQTRPPPDTTGTRPPPDTTTPQTQTRVSVLASISARSSGFLDVGDVRDVHRIGMTKDGMVVNAAHIAATSLFRNEVGDGPLDFEADAYEDPEFGGPFLTPVHLRWDKGVTHDWACGSAPGRWRWAAESFFFIPAEKTQTTTRPYVPPRVPPWPPTQPPPLECQNVPGGGGQVDAPGGTMIGPGLGLTGATSIGLDSFDGAGNPTGSVTVGTGGGGGQQGISNTGGTYGVPGNGPLVSGLLDAGIGAANNALAAVSEFVSGAGSAAGSAADATGVEVPGPGVPTGLGLDGPGSMSPGGEPTRAKQKGGSGNSGAEGVLPGGETGGSRPPKRETEEKPEKACYPTYEPNRMPRGGLSVFGGGNLNPQTQYALMAEGVIDESGRPMEVPPPLVGDGDATRMGQLAGVTARQPTAAQTMCFGGGVKFGAFATAAGSVDLTRGGWIGGQVGLLADAGNVGSFVGYGNGNGSWEDLQAPEGQESIPGGVVFGPAELTSPENLQLLFDGEFHFDSQFTNNSVGVETALYMPGGLSSLCFSHPSAGSANGTVGQGGVRMGQTSVGLMFTALTSTGADSATDLLFGEGGLNLDGNMDIDGNLDVSGKLTVGGSIDPTDVQYSDRNGGAATIPAAAAGHFYDSAINTRPSWKEDNVNGDNLEHALAYLSDTGAGLVQELGNTVETVVSCTGGWPFDDTIPQIGEGTEIITQAITPTSLANFIEVEFVAHGGLSSANSSPSVALFRDAVAGAITAQIGSSSGAVAQASLKWRFAVPSLAAQTYRIRGGAFAGTWHVNGNQAGARRLGGVASAVLIVREVQ